MIKKSLNLAISFSLFGLLPTSLSYADDVDFFATPFQPYQLKTSQTDLGGIGLIQMPSGRMAEEGAFSIGYNHNSEYQFYTVSLQLMPWLETTIRYTQVEDLLYSQYESFSGNTKLADKGIDAKLRLLQESQWLPEVSVGLRDLGGTGLFDGEFIAATKRLSTNDYGQFDFTLGLGWGYLGQRGNTSNPLCSTSEHFCNRVSGYSGNGGGIDYNRWFTGNAALFGGIEYQTPYQPLRLKLEYDGNDYSQDVPSTKGGVDMTPKSPWNIGVVYAANDSLNLRASYERGDTLALGFTFSTNFSDMKAPWKDESLPTLTNNQATRLDDVNWKKLDKDLGKIAGYQVTEIHQEENDTISIFATQTKYRNRDTALERASAVLANELPDNINTYKIIETQKNLPLTAKEISAKSYRDVAMANYINPNINDAVENIEPKRLESEPLYDSFDPFSFSVSPHISQALGNPESFYLYTFGLNTNASYWFNHHLELGGSAYFNIADNLDKINFTAPTSDGTSNYRVRTLVREYVHDNDAYLNNLQLTWFQKYGQNLYQQIYAGYLESMFAGFGSEILYRQQNTNWAIGADWSVISQRKPDSWLGTFSHENEYSYSSKVLAEGSTGHLSIYYQPKWSFLKDTLIRVDMGKFLATDIGTRLNFSKQYKSGVIVGAYASKTNMSAEQFGEGSFTKGFYLSIPFDAISVKPSTSRATFSWQPLTRDGGQMLNKRHSLFSTTDPVSPWYQKPSKVEK